MKTYTLKLKTTSTTDYNLYDGTTLVSDTDLGTLFGSAGEAYFTFDFNSLTPTDTTSLTILNSQDTAVITNTGLSGIAENKNFKGTWSASATAFDSFALLTGVAMDEAQLSKLASMVKTAQAGGIKTLTTADYNWPATGTKTGVATWLLDEGVYVIGENNLQVNFLSSSASTLSLNRVLIVSKAGTNTTALNVADGLYYYRVNNSGTALNTVPGVDGFAVLLSNQTVNNLTSTEIRSPLSANQGKVLNERIGDLTTLTTTAKTSTVAAINELDAEMPILEITDTDPGADTTTTANTITYVYV